MGAVEPLGPDCLSVVVAFVVDTLLDFEDSPVKTVPPARAIGEVDTAAVVKSIVIVTDDGDDCRSTPVDRSAVVVAGPADNWNSDIDLRNFDSDLWDTDIDLGGLDTD